MNPLERIQGAFGAMGGQLSPQQQQMGVLPPAAQMASQAPQTGMFAKFNNHLQDNKAAMMAMASGMMGGPGQPGSFGQGFQNYVAASPLDAQRQEKEQNRNATHDWLKKNGHSDEDIAFFQANPQMMAEALKPKTADMTSGMKEYQLAQQQGFDGSFFDFKKELAKSGASNINFNNEQAKAAGFADRARAAENVLSQLDSEGLNTGAKLKDGLPFGVGNFFQSDEFQQYDQARRDFVNATLRRESGAVISPNEFANAEQQYFPQPGDGPGVIEQKRRNRQLVIEGMVRGAGESYQPPAAQPPATPAPDLSSMSDADLEAIANGGQ
jgi:hypothetical protein